MRLKYVMFDEFFPVLFGEYCNHADVTIKGLKPTSSGFVNVTSEGVFCVGNSFSLQLESNTDDTEIVRNLLKGKLL
jgi:hypothetical protein